MIRVARYIPRTVVLLAVALLLNAGCDTTGANEVDPEYVVEAYLIAGETLPPVRLTQTVDLGRAYNYDSLAVRGAEVTIVELGADGGPVARYPYRTMRDTAGVYVPFGAERARPLTSYRLEVTVPATGQRIRSTTTVPDTFSIVNANAREVVYQSPQQLELTLTRSRYPGRDQSFYIFSTQSFEPIRSNLTPLLREVIDDQEDASLQDLRITSSPVLNEESYEVNADGTLTLQLPWLAVAFYGRNRTTANAIDDNLYDFVRTQSAQQRGGGFTPGSIPNVIEHVEGGTGVFGSIARQSYDVTVLRPEIVSGTD
jgi:hypothetical protein